MTQLIVMVNQHHISLNIEKKYIMPNLIIIIPKEEGILIIKIMITLSIIIKEL